MPKLNRSKCRLIPESDAQLLDQFDRLAVLVDELKERFSALFAATGAPVASSEPSPDTYRRKPRVFREVDATLERARAVLERERYTVGFLGSSQAGKSSVMNRVVEREVCSPGGGVAATSTPTRLRRSSGESCTLNFMTLDEIKSRRDSLCKVLALDAALSDPQLETKLGELRANDPKHVNDKSRGYLLRLLQSVRLHGGVVRKDRVSRPGDFKKRRDYTNHPPDQQSTEYALLADVEFGFPSDILDDRIELIDLPGLGAELEDDALTTSFLDRLDGALVFQSAEHVDKIEVRKLLTELKKRFATGLRNRVWMVITKMDIITQDAHGKDGQNSFLDNLHGALVRNDMPDDQILFCSAEFHKLLNADPFQRDPTEKDYEILFKLVVDEDGKPEIPDAFRKHPLLCASFERHVLADGGIKALRDVVQSRLAEAVRKQARADVEQDLIDAREGLAIALRDAIESIQLDPEAVKAAVTWRVELQLLRKRVQTNLGMFVPLGRELKNQLRKDFEERTPEELDIDEKELEHFHADRVELLCIDAERGFQGAFGAAESMIRSELTRIATKIGVEPATDGDDGPMAVWRKRFSALSADRKWIKDSLDALEGGRGPLPSLNTKEYRQLMLKKIDEVVHHAFHVMSLRLVALLREIEGTLTRLKDLKGKLRREDSDQLTDTLARLERT